MTGATSASSRHREWWVVGAIVAAIALVVGTWVLASRFQSPAQRQAAAQPPPAQPVLVDVIRADLVQQTTTLATGTRDEARTVPIPLAASGASVVTRTGIAVGGTLSSGSVLAWVNDRPILVLRGEFPLFRDIGEGDEGDDVRLLQQALVDLGYSISVDGDFGAQTAWCVKDLYSGVGSFAHTRQGTRPQASATPTTTQTDADSATDHSPTPVAPTQVVVLASEVLVIPGLPAQVASVPPQGTVLTAETAKVEMSATAVSVSARVPGAVAATLTQSTAGVATLGDTSIDVRIAAIRPIQDSMSDSNASAQASTQSTVSFVAATGSFPEEWAGHQDILFSVNLSEPVRDVLQVPQRAIAVNASGSSSILVQQRDGSFQEVVVSELGCVAGTCAIEDAAGVEAGSRVRVDR